MKSFLFDNEDVLVSTSWDLVAQTAAANLGLTILTGKDFKRALQLGGSEHDNPLARYSCGELSTVDYWSQVLKSFNLPESPENIRLMGSALEALTTTIDPDAIGVLGQLSERGYPLYLISNATPEIHQGNSRRNDYFRLFDALYISFQTGLRKPDPRAYQNVLAKHSLEPGDCLFIDDKKDNLDAAYDLGIPVLQHQIGETPLSEKLARFLSDDRR